MTGTVEKSIIDFLAKLIKYDVSGYDYKNVYEKLEKVYMNEIKYSKYVMKITISNNEISYENITHDNRKKDFIDLFDKTKKYLAKTNRKLSDCVIYLYVIDSYNFEHQDLPFFIMARPSNKKGILIPDNTFHCHNIEHRCFNWDDTKKIVVNNCMIDNSEKINKIFFRGANTGADKHNLRGLLAKDSINNDVFDITIGSHQIPLYEFCKYKYLLNLPGHQPWSYRFKYLFLMNSLVINIDLKQNYKSSSNDTWINFFDRFFKENIDYVNIIYDWYDNDNSKNEQNYLSLLQNIIEVYERFENDPSLYKRMVEHGHNVAMSISQNIIYESVYMIVEEYAKKIINSN